VNPLRLDPWRTSGGPPRAEENDMEEPVARAGMLAPSLILLGLTFQLDKEWERVIRGARST